MKLNKFDAVEIDDSLIGCSKGFGKGGNYVLHHVIMINGETVVSYKRDGNHYYRMKGVARTAHKFNLSQLKEHVKGNDLFLVYLCKQSNVKNIDETEVHVDKSGLIGPTVGLSNGLNETLLDLVSPIPEDILPENHTIGKYCLEKRVPVSVKN